jgi:hypothetical protein
MSVDFNELVAKQILGLEYGTLQLTVKVHRNQVSKVETVKATSVKVDSTSPDAEAAGVIISVLKSRQGSLSDESVGFSVLRRHGKPIQVQVQEFVSEQV